MTATLKLGDTTFKLYVIPGHTLGTLATVFTVHDKGKAHRAVAWGGTAYNFGPLPTGLQIYADTTAKYRPIMKRKRPRCCCRTTSATTMPSARWAR